MWQVKHKQNEREGRRDLNNGEWLKELADSQQHISRGVVVVRLKKGKTFPGQTSKVLVWLRQQTAEWKRGRGSEQRQETGRTMNFN